MTDWFSTRPEEVGRGCQRGFGPRVGEDALVLRLTSGTRGVAPPGEFGRGSIIFPSRELAYGSHSGRAGVTALRAGVRRFWI